MSMYGQFRTDGTLETKGIELDYGDFRITIARAGGANKKFARLLETKTKPYRRAIQTETMDNELAVDVLRHVYALAIVLNWEAKVPVKDGAKDETKFATGIEAPDGGEKLLPVNEANIVATFKALPDLFADVQEQANKVALFRQEILENDAGN